MADAPDPVEPADLGDYQRAVRQVLTRDLITAARPRAGVLDQVLPWSDRLAHDFRELFGYQLIATTHMVRLVRRLDSFDATQGQLFAKNRRPFDRRRLAYLCLVLATFQRSRVEISLADLVRLVTPMANGIEGLGFEPTVAAHKAALVDAIDWLVDHGALRLSDGSLEAWARDDRTGDALYDIDHEICTVLFKPARPVQHLTSAAGLLHAGVPDVMREARRLLVEHPVVYFSEVRPELAEALPLAAEELAAFTGLSVERRAEGVMLADASGRFTDRPFPGQGGAVNRAAGLLLAEIAGLVEEGDLERRVVPDASTASVEEDLLARIDAALPEHGVVTGLAWTPPETKAADRPGESEGLWFVPQDGLDGIIAGLYAEFGAASFTGVWQADPSGLLAAAVAFLCDLRLLRRVPGGVLVLPAAFRYRNITLALPERGQLSLEETPA
ncbi:DUF2398 family protein [Actinocorallia aurantiaca]|uniref:TIGR02678 family protein n=1 Tax=Actinocorallia aurantiaca TaxID=46204 RepID=A0ABN3UB49_9ACTN